MDNSKITSAPRAHSHLIKEQVKNTKIFLIFKHSSILIDSIPQMQKMNVTIQRNLRFTHFAFRYNKIITRAAEHRQFFDAGDSLEKDAGSASGAC